MFAWSASTMSVTDSTASKASRLTPRATAAPLGGALMGSQSIESSDEASSPGAAVHGQVDAGAVAARVGGEEQHGLRDLLERRLAGDAAVVRVGARLVQEAGDLLHPRPIHGDVAAGRADGVHADAVAAELERGGLSEAAQRPLRGGVGRDAVHAEQRVDRADVHDRAAALLA